MAQISSIITVINRSIIEIARRINFNSLTYNLTGGSRYLIMQIFRILLRITARNASFRQKLPPLKPPQNPIYNSNPAICQKRLTQTAPQYGHVR